LPFIKSISKRHFRFFYKILSNQIHQLSKKYFVNRASGKSFCHNLLVMMLIALCFAASASYRPAKSHQVKLPLSSKLFSIAEVSFDEDDLNDFHNNHLIPTAIISFNLTELFQVLHFRSNSFSQEFENKFSSLPRAPPLS
jgi:hypothetical protein